MKNKLQKVIKKINEINEFNKQKYNRLNIKKNILGA